MNVSNQHRLETSSGRQEKFGKSKVGEGKINMNVLRHANSTFPNGQLSSVASMARQRSSAHVRSRGKCYFWGRKSGVSNNKTNAFFAFFLCLRREFFSFAEKREENKKIKLKNCEPRV